MYPDIKRFVAEAIEVVFVPRVVVRQIGLALALETGVVTVRQVLAIVQTVHSNF